MRGALFSNDVLSLEVWDAEYRDGRKPAAPYALLGGVTAGVITAVALNYFSTMAAPVRSAVNGISVN